MTLLSSFGYFAGHISISMPILWLAVGCGTLYTLVLGIYRVYFSPLASIPGPRLAALTGWVEAYYELIHGEGGQFMFKYREWHEKYGPIIRITPNEVHIQDASFFETLYATKPATKRPDLAHRFNNAKSVFATPEHDIHRIRRNALNPFFSKRAILERARVIQEHMDALCQRLKSEFQGRSRVLVINDMLACWTTDIITDYCFDRRHNFIMEPDFKPPLIRSLTDLIERVHWITQFVWLAKLMFRLPDIVVGWIDPLMKNGIQYSKELSVQVIETINNSDQKEQPDTIFTSIIQSDIPRSEVTKERLLDEATNLIGAGVETTMRTLTISIYHITTNPSVHQRLREELFKAIPNSEEMPSLEVLQRLPYLTLCIEESLRLSYGVSQRIPRLYSHDITYGKFVIPKGTVISMSIYDVSHDETIFPDSFKYRPERWAENPRSPDGRQLTRYMVAFGRGMRSCIGMQLAYAELFVSLATLFRRFSFEVRRSFAKNTPKTYAEATWQFIAYEIDNHKAQGRETEVVLNHKAQEKNKVEKEVKRYSSVSIRRRNLPPKRSEGPKPPHNFLLGHLNLMREIAGGLPPDLHPQAYLTVIAQKYNLKGIWYLDLWPLADTQVVLTEPEPMDAVQVARGFDVKAEDSLRPLVGSNAIAAANGPVWKQLHHAMAPAFSTSHVRTQIGLMVAETLLFCDSLKSFSRSKDVFSMEAEASKLVFDIVGRIIFDFPLYAQTKGSTCVKVLLLAGHGTVVDTLCYIFMLLSKNPDAVRKIRKEQSEVFGEDRSSTLRALEDNPAKVNDLVYTTAVIKETLRIFPVGFALREAPLNTTLVYDNRSYPIDNALIVPCWHTMHFDPRYYPEPDDFRPERFLNDEVPRSWFRSFSRGPRACLGQNLSLDIMRIILLMTVRDFDFTCHGLEPNAKPKASYTNLDTIYGDVVFQELGGLEARPRGGMMMTVAESEPRNST
ncbi:hypothetical protein GQX73_g1881 [Xylaria multiplex]|uniref:Cytochrome P450 n=1 Tax=Xylaria multiplex TaxID=323545 RepID=A0A7C8IT54_9PEZI|nr:hypothetical protein GQX73_g1881 [Xylaria multiplex]